MRANIWLGEIPIVLAAFLLLGTAYIKKEKQERITHDDLV
jgi:hypothetical protein